MTNGLKWSSEWLDAHLRKNGRPVVPAVQPTVKPKGQPRIKNAKIVIDPETGKKVQSGHESKVIKDYRTLFRAGEYDMIATQVWFRLDGGMYIADIVAGKIVDVDGVPHLRLEVIDAKGHLTDMYKRNRRGMAGRYNIKIQEIYK